MQAANASRRCAADALLLAASALAGRADVTSIEDAHRAVSDLLGPAIGVLLAAGLLAAGLASTSVGSQSPPCS